MIDENIKLTDSLEPELVNVGDEMLQSFDATDTCFDIQKRVVPTTAFVVEQIKPQISKEDN